MLAQEEDIDLERELHKVYKMFCVNQAKLISMKGIINFLEQLLKLIFMLLC